MRRAAAGCILAIRGLRAVVCNRSLQCVWRCNFTRVCLCVWSEQSLSMNSDMSRLAINGHTEQGVEKLVSRIGYVNSHTKPLTGRSTVTFSTDVTWVWWTFDLFSWRWDPLQFHVTTTSYALRHIRTVGFLLTGAVFFDDRMRQGHCLGSNFQVNDLFGKCQKVLVGKSCEGKLFIANLT